MNNGFVSWDDRQSFIENPDYRGLGLSQLRWMFSTTYFCNYQPVSWMTFGLDFMLWGLRPFGYHLTSLLFHCANAVAFYFLCLSLWGCGRPQDEDRWGAAFAALLFSLHPLRVEAVAWASARRDVVSGLFFMLTLLSWLRAVRPSERHPRRWMMAALLAYLLSLLSKVVTVTLPAVLVLLDLYPLKRIPLSPRRWLRPSLRGLWLEKAPFAVLALSFAAVGVGAQAHCGAVLSLAQSGGAARVIHALFGIAFYIGKTLWPTGLSPLYENNVHSYASTLTAGGAALAGFCSLAWAHRLRPMVAAALAYYVITLSPVLLVQLGHQLAADRYSYLPCLVWALLAGAGCRSLLRTRATSVRPRVHLPAVILAALMFVPLCAQTIRQVGIWEDSTTFWRTVLRLDPYVSVARANLADALMGQRRVGEAILYLEEQVRLFPADPYSVQRLSRLIADLGVTERDHARFHGELGLENVQRGEWGKAEWHYRKALAYDPASAGLRADLEAVLRRASKKKPRGDQPARLP